MFSSYSAINKSHFNANNFDIKVAGYFDSLQSKFPDMPII